jgi:hypothetical protein
MDVRKELLGDLIDRAAKVVQAARSRDSYEPCGHRAVRATRPVPRHVVPYRCTSRISVALKSSRLETFWLQNDEELLIEHMGR